MRDPKLVEEFKALLDAKQESGKKKELEIQRFLENKPELIPTPNRLNHQVHLSVIISQFPLGNRFITDYVYITKSSDCWRIVFVELEIPEKKIFTNANNQVNTSAAFNAALNQVRSWQDYLQIHGKEVIKQLEPLMIPPSMRRNPIEFCFELIYGRSAEKNSADRKRYLNNLSNDNNIKIMTYDTLISYYENDLYSDKDIMSLKQGKFHYKNLSTKPEHVFSHIGPGDLELTREQKNVLRADGYEIDKWCGGEFLTRNVKYTESGFEAMNELKNRFARARSRAKSK